MFFYQRLSGVNMKSLSFRISLVFCIISAFLIAMFIWHSIVASNIGKSLDDTDTNIRRIEYSENLLAIINTIRLHHARTVALDDTSELFKLTLRSNRIAVDSFIEVSKIFKYSVDSRSDALVIDSINQLFKIMNNNFDIHIHNKNKNRNDYFNNVIPQYLQIQNLLFSLFNSNLELINQNREKNSNKFKKYFGTINLIIISTFIAVILLFIAFRFIFFDKIKNRHIALDGKLAQTFPNIFDERSASLDVEEKINKIIEYYDSKDKDNLKLIITEKNRINHIRNEYCEVFFVLDKDLNTIYYNNSAIAQFGLNDIEILNLPLNQIRSSNDLFQKFAITLKVFIEDMVKDKNCHLVEELVDKNNNYCIEITVLCDELQSYANYFLIRFYNSI